MRHRPFKLCVFTVLRILTISILPVTRFITRNILSRSSLYGIPVIIFGEGEWAQDVVKSLRRVRRLGWRPHSLHPLERINVQKDYDSTFVAILASTVDTPLGEMVRTLNQYFRKVILIQREDNFGSLWVETRDLDSYLGLEFQYHLLSKRNLWLKRMIDLVGAMLLLILLGPLLILLSILVAIDSPGPVFFQQERLGKDFRRFDLLKFRTMVLGAEEKLRLLLETDHVAKAEYDEFHKLENDPRVTKFGLFLRRFSLDELPQFWNVLKGEMSLSGPRAYMPSEREMMGSYAATILRVTPGVTGWWQVLGRHSTTFEKRLHMDEYYISNWSLWMDAYIFLRTVLVVLSGKGA